MRFYSDSIGMIFTSVALLSLISVVFGVVIVVFLMRSIVQHQAASAKAGVSLPIYLAGYCVLPPLIILMLGVLWVNSFFADEGSSGVYTKYPPEYYFARSLYDFVGQGYAEQINISEAQKVKLASMGLPLETASVEYPFFRPSVYLAESPQLASYDEPPNVILVMSESLSSYFMEDPAMRALDITPNMQSFGEGHALLLQYSQCHYADATGPDRHIGLFTARFQNHHGYGKTGRARRCQ